MIPIEIKRTDTNVVILTGELPLCDCPPSNPGYDVFVVIKQSQAYSAQPIDLNIDIYPPNCFQLGDVVPDKNVIIPLLTEPVDQYNLRNSSAIGPMCTFAQDYQANGNLEAGREMLMVGCALSGTGFNDNRWNKGDDLYESAKARTILALSNPGAVLKGIIFCGAERECQSPVTPEILENYLINFFVDFKQDIGQAYSNARVVFLGMAPTWIAETQLRIDIDAKYQTGPEMVEWSGYAPSTGLITWDGIHYDAPSERIMGHRAYTAWVEAGTNDWTESVPPAINDLYAAQLPDSEISLSFTAVEAYPYPEGNRIYKRVNGTSPWVLDQTITGTSAVITGLVENEYYNFKVNAFNYTGEAPDGNIVTIQAVENPSSYSHLVRYAFDNNLDNGDGNTSVGFGTIGFVDDATRGYCLQLNDINSGVVAAINDPQVPITIPLGSSWTKSIWINASSVGIRHIMSSNSAIGTVLMIQGSQVRVGTLASMYQITSPVLAVGWHLVQVRCNGVTGVTQLIIDGVLIGTATILNVPTHEIAIGNKYGHAGGFVGMLDDGRIYLYEATDSELIAIGQGTII